MNLKILTFTYLLLFFSCSPPCQIGSSEFEINQMLISPNKTHIAFHLNYAVDSDSGLHIYNIEKNEYFKTDEKNSFSTPVFWETNEYLLVEQMDNSPNNSVSKKELKSPLSNKLFNIRSKTFIEVLEKENIQPDKNFSANKRNASTNSLTFFNFYEGKLRKFLINTPEEFPEDFSLVWTPLKDRVFVVTENCEDICKHTFNVANWDNKKSTISQVEKVVDFENGFSINGGSVFTSQSDKKLKFIRHSHKNKDLYAEYSYLIKEKKLTIEREFPIPIDLVQAMRMEGYSLFSPKTQKIIFSVSGKGLYTFDLESKQTKTLLEKSDFSSSLSNQPFCPTLSLSK